MRDWSSRDPLEKSHRGIRRSYENAAGIPRAGKKKWKQSEIRLAVYGRLSVSSRAKVETRDQTSLTFQPIYKNTHFLCSQRSSLTSHLPRCTHFFPPGRKFYKRVPERVRSPDAFCLAFFGFSRGSGEASALGERAPSSQRTSKRSQELR